MKTSKINYLLKTLLLLIFALFLFNCSTDSIEQELEEENVIEQAAKFGNVCDCIGTSGGTGENGAGNDGDKDDNNDPDDTDGDGDPDNTDPQPHNPCVYTPGSPGNPFVNCDFN